MAFSSSIACGKERWARRGCTCCRTRRLRPSLLASPSGRCGGRRGGQGRSAGDPVQAPHRDGEGDRRDDPGERLEQRQREAERDQAADGREDPAGQARPQSAAS